MSISDLGARTASLLSLQTATEERALHQLAELGASQVPGCCAASVTLWRDGEIASQASSHPDATRLVQVQLEAGDGPMLDALAGHGPVRCADVLTESRWPLYAAAAARLGVRCTVTLCAGEELTVALALLAARPNAIDPDQVELAEVVAAYSAALVGAVSDYRESQRTRAQLQDAAAGRALVDQAKGILMHALGCSADEALAKIRDVSQRSNLRATEVAARVIDAHGGNLEQLSFHVQPRGGRRRQP
jgi:ANTAR domain-containing protein